jgi:hypothetical protein
VLARVMMHRDRVCSAAASAFTPRLPTGCFVARKCLSPPKVDHGLNATFTPPACAELDAEGVGSRHDDPPRGCAVNAVGGGHWP